MKKKVYIAGKITGLPYSEVFEKFKSKQNELESKGFDVVNPCELLPEEFQVPKWLQDQTPHVIEPWTYAMRVCVTHLSTCHSIYLLPCWNDSKGATIERNLADHLGLEFLN